GRKRGEGEGDVQDEGQKKRQRAEAEAKNESADDACEERRQPEQRQIERGVFGASRVGKIRRDEAGTTENECDDDEPGKEIKSKYREAERHATDAEAGENHPDDIETLMFL